VGWGGVVRGVRVWNRESFPEPSDDELAEHGYVAVVPKRRPSGNPRGASQAAYTKVCLDCPTKIRHSSTRCKPCYFAYRGFAPPKPRRQVPSRRRDDVDEVAVQRVLSGDGKVPTTKAEKELVAAKWLALGRTAVSLHELTGWRVERYIRRDQAA
jgi:hypothetical protein